MSDQFPQRKFSKIGLVIRIGLLILLAVTVVMTIFGVGIYAYDWEGPVTRAWGRIVPYPAAIVDGQNVTYAEFWEAHGVRFKSIPDQPYFPEKRTQTINGLVRDAAVEAIAKRHHISVSEEEVRAYYQERLEELDEKQTKALNDRPWWFIRKRLRITLLRKKLDEAGIYEEIGSDKIIIFAQ